MSAGVELPARARGGWSLTRPIALLFALVTVLATAALVAVPLLGSLPILRELGLEFLTESRWSYRHGRFGVAAMIYGTVVTSAIALALAAPIGILSATCIAERLRGLPRDLVKQALELLAVVPSVVYGLLGIVFLRPLVHRGLPFVDPSSGDTLLTGGLLLAIMILPTILTFSEDAIRAVPSAEREAGLALGLSPRELITAVVWPRARPGLLAAVLLGLGRALGETIAVFLVVGRSDGQWPKGPLDLSPILRPGQTLTTKLGGHEIAEAWGDPRHWSAMMGAALTLLVTVGILLLLGSLLRGRRANT